MSNNRTYIAKLNDGCAVKVTWHNGVQTCSLIEKGESVELPRSKISVDTKGSTPNIEAISGETVKLSYKDLRKEVLAGHTVYNRQGKKIPCTKMAERTPDKVVKVIINKKGETKVYQIL